MIKNYFKIALRNLRKHKGYALINLFGLAIGMAACLLILQYVTYELSYDDFHTDADRIYRVRYDFFRDGEQVFKSATTFPKIGPALKTDFPEVEETARLFLRYGGAVVRYEDQSFKEENLFQADSSFLTLFSFAMVAGDPATALAEPGTAVISTETARKFFGDEDPMGKHIQVGNNEEYVITGVMESPENSHLKISLLFSYATLVQAWGEEFDNAWGWYDFYVYLRLKPGANPTALEAKLPDFVDRHGDDETEHENTVLSLQRLQDIHLYSNLIQEARVNGDGTSVYFLMIIAFFILIIAWVNYINLSTARAIERAREIGIRKVVGAAKGQLIRQFLLESLLINMAAVLLALVVLELTSPLFNALVGKSLPLNLGGSTLLWAVLAGLLIFGALLSGLYPAFVLSSYRPVVVLKGTFSRAQQGLTLRKGLVIGQFVASVGLIAGTLIIYQQLSFMQTQDLGIDIEQTLVVEGPDVLENDSLYAEQMGAFKEEVLRHPHIKQVAVSTEIPGNLIYWTSGARKVEAPPEASTIMYKVGIDYAYLETYGHELLAGRGFSPDHRTDDQSVILNEAALRVLGLPEPAQALNEKVRIGGDTLTVVGVMANYHQVGLQKAFDPTAFLLRPASRSYYALKVSTDDLPETIAYAQQQYQAFFPENPFTHYFLDDFFNGQYQHYGQFGKVFGVFALLAILVACLGLFGLSSFTAAQRTKEIGIRKVLGSSASRILVLLSKDFLKLVLVGSVIAVPLVWYLMEQWLQGFAFRISINAWIFLAATGLTLVIALVTVSYQSIKAALADPVKSLRYE